MYFQRYLFQLIFINSLCTILPYHSLFYYVASNFSEIVIFYPASLIEVRVFDIGEQKFFSCALVEWFFLLNNSFVLPINTYKHHLWVAQFISIYSRSILPQEILNCQLLFSVVPICGKPVSSNQPAMFFFFLKSLLFFANVPIAVQ